MSQCGPVNPCPACRDIYLQDPRWVPDEGAPGSFRIAVDKDLVKRPRRVQVRPVDGALRLPVARSKAEQRRRRRAKQRRKS